MVYGITLASIFHSYDHAFFSLQTHIHNSRTMCFSFASNIYHGELEDKDSKCFVIVPYAHS
jgi:hypothetical protein